jgi:hypothetical protein
MNVWCAIPFAAAPGRGLVAAYLDAIDTLIYAHELAEHRRSAQLKAIAPLASE